MNKRIAIIHNKNCGKKQQEQQKNGQCAKWMKKNIYIYRFWLSEVLVIILITSTIINNIFVQILCLYAVVVIWAHRSSILVSYLHIAETLFQIVTHVLIGNFNSNLH